MLGRVLSGEKGDKMVQLKHEVPIPSFVSTDQQKGPPSDHGHHTCFAYCTISWETPSSRLVSSQNLLLILDDDLDLFTTSNRFQSFFGFGHGVRDRNEGFQIHNASIQHIDGRWET